jgi:hypothetical protein
MTKDEALRLALEKLTAASNYIDTLGGVSKGYRIDIENLKAALEANEFNPDWDTQAVLVEEIQRMAKRIEELEAKDEPVAIDLATMELAESVGLIGPASRTHDLHNAIQRFHDLICANATIKAAVAFSCTLEAKDETFMASYEHKQYGYYKDESGSLKLGDIPQRKWVGLTTEDILNLGAGIVNFEYAKAIEAKLKEKNT